MIINAGIKTVFYEDGYPDALSEELIKEAGIKLTKIQKNVK
jgi:dCMP deaminase